MNVHIRKGYPLHNVLHNVKTNTVSITNRYQFTYDPFLWINGHRALCMAKWRGSLLPRRTLMHFYFHESYNFCSLVSANYCIYLLFIERWVVIYRYIDMCINRSIRNAECWQKQIRMIRKPLHICMCHGKLLRLACKKSKNNLDYILQCTDSWLIWCKMAK